MGWLARHLAEERRDWLTDDETMFEGSTTASGTRVNRESAMKQSVVWACVRLLTNTIATLPRDIIVSLGSTRFPLDRPDDLPSWINEPNESDPTMTGTEHFAQVATSLLLDGSFFTWAPLGIFEPQPLILLDPRRVEVKPDTATRPYYRITNAMGQVIAEVGPLNMLQGSWIRMPGALRGLSPIEAARQGIGLGLTAEEFGARFFSQGAALSFGVEVPGPLTDPQKEDLREQLRKNYAGTKRSHSVGVLTAGAKFVPGLGITNEQAQFLELRKFTVEDIARWFGVPPHMVGSQEPGASSYNSVEQRSLEFREYAVLPLARRIEDPYQRLVEVPTRLAGGNASAAFRFNLNALARADIKTRYESYSQGINAGVLKPDEARALEDLPPVPGGGVTYMQQQMVPIGTGPAPEALHPVRTEPIEIHLNAAALHVAPPPAPIVNIPAPVVNVSVPEVRAPVVNVTVPEPVINVTMPEEQVLERWISRDPEGRIAAIHEKRGRAVRRIEVRPDGRHDKDQ